MRWYPRNPASTPVHINSYLCPINIAKHQSTNQTKHIETQWRLNDDRIAAKAYQASIKRDRPDCSTHSILTRDLSINLAPHRSTTPIESTWSNRLSSPSPSPRPISPRPIRNQRREANRRKDVAEVTRPLEPGLRIDR